MDLAKATIQAENRLEGDFILAMLAALENS